MVAVNEGVADYNLGDVGEVCNLLQTLRSSCEHEKLCVANPVLGWVWQVDQQELLKPYDFNPCACGYAAMDGVMQYREKEELGYVPADTCISHFEFELNFLDVDELDSDYDRKAQEDEAEVHRISTPPRYRGITQICDLHEFPTNNIWVLIDDSFENLNDRLVPTYSGLPVPGMHTLTLYPPGFHITQDFVQVKCEDLSLRCVHGCLHPPAVNSCLECFPSGRRFNCDECESHPLPQKPKGQDSTIVEHNEIETGKLNVDCNIVQAQHVVQQKKERMERWEVQTAHERMKYAW